MDGLTGLKLKEIKTGSDDRSPLEIQTYSGRPGCDGLPKVEEHLVECGG